MGEYKVQFVGLAYFLHEPEGRHVLLPDGRDLPNVVKHLGTIAVAADQLAGEGTFTGWTEDDIIRSTASAAISGTGEERTLLQFVLSGDSIEIEGASSAVENEPLDTAEHNDRLQPLNDDPDAPRVMIAPQGAQTVGDVRIRRGKLIAFRFPGSDDDGSAAIISELRVPYESETVTITVRPKVAERDRLSSSSSFSEESNVRTITVRNGAEIAIVNASRPADGAAEDETEHFNIYRQLAPGRLTLGEPRPTPIGELDASPSEHLLFRIPGVIGSSIKCSNICC